MGMTRWVRYTLVARWAALASRAEPGGVKCETSAMCTPMRNCPSPRSSMDRASSRSLAVGGSMLNSLAAAERV